MTKPIRPRRPMATIALLAVSLPLLSGLRAEDPPKPPDAFEGVDLAFRQFYARGRAATLAKLGPVIVVEGDRLVLIRDGRRSEATVIPPLYHRLKAISHVPLALYVALAPLGDGPIADDQLGRLKEFRVKVEAVADSLERSGLTPSQVARSRALLARCTTFLDGVIAAGRHEPAGLEALTRAAAPVVLANADDAARAQVDAYHARVSAWRRELPAGEWSGLRVVVLGPAMPRRHNVAVQYFAKLMGLEGESRRLVYAEELIGERQGVDLLATHQLDSELSGSFFGSPDRMDIDLLGNAASVYLDGLDLGR